MTLGSVPGLMGEVRSRFAHVETCPFSGPRIFFENAGGALTLKSVVETSAAFASYPDNQGRDNPASAALMAVISGGRADMRTFFNAPSGQVFVGESGTEVLFRLVRTAALGAAAGGRMIGSTLEHPASRGAMAHWAKITARPHVLVAHDDARGGIDAEAYGLEIGPDLRVATIIHTSPVTGRPVDVGAIAAAIRAAAPECLIIVDGIQHASHGPVDVRALGIDGYAISPYKVFSRHGYGVGWASDRLTALHRETLTGAPVGTWELGTRDAGSYATFSNVVTYFDWLGGHFTAATDRRARLEAAAKAISSQEAALAEVMLHGTGNLGGLATMRGVTIIGGSEGAREGVISFAMAGLPAAEIVTRLSARGIRTHVRKDDYYSGNVLKPLGLAACVRVSYSHYNTEAEITQFLAAMHEIAAT